MFFLFLILAVFLIYIVSIEMHEIAHIQINKYFGVDSHIEYFTKDYPISTVADNKFSNSEDRRFAYFAHSINEAVGYQLTPYFLGVMLLQIILIMSILTKKDSKI